MGRSRSHSTDSGIRKFTRPRHDRESPVEKGLAMHKIALFSAAALMLAACGGSSSPGHYQTVRMDDNHCMIIDADTGDVWYFTHAALATSLRYVGHLRPGDHAGEILGAYHVNVDDFKQEAAR